ncbi:MAG: pentapeptide repeat-containing protein [Solirubrobacterales bacterium]
MLISGSPALIPATVHGPRSKVAKPGLLPSRGSAAPAAAALVAALCLPALPAPAGAAALRPRAAVLRRAELRGAVLRRAELRGAVLRRADPRGVRAYWTQRRMRRAAALPLLSPEGARGPRAAAAAAGARTSAVETGTGDPTAYPASANGVVFGTYATGSGEEDFRCSGSVVNAPAGNLVLTAGHCVVDPETGTEATNLAFVPGYRSGSEPFGEWPATSIATTAAWRNSAGTAETDEAGDLAIFSVAPRSSDGAGLEHTVGALGIAFDRPRRQTYVQYGYPAESPYDGSRLLGNSSSYAFGDAYFSPPTLGIESGFTGGSSGGPWTVGSPPVAVSVTAYYYTSVPGYLFGPYFGTLARGLFEKAGGNGAGSRPRLGLRILSVRRHPGAGAATVVVLLSGPGRLTLGGASVRSAAAAAEGAGRFRVALRARGRTARRLRRSGRARVPFRISFRLRRGARFDRRGVLTLVHR